MFRHSLRPYYLMSGLIALFLAITAAAGLFIQDIYQPFMSEGLVAAQFIQDFVSLLCAPLLVAAMIYTRRGSARAFVLWGGLLVSVDLAAFGRRVNDRMPVRFIAVIRGMTLLFVPLWLGMMAQDIRAQQARPTATVFVPDLAFLIPACTYAAVHALRGSGAPSAICWAASY